MQLSPLIVRIPIDCPDTLTDYTVHSRLTFNQFHLVQSVNTSLLPAKLYTLQLHNLLSLYVTPLLCSLYIIVLHQDNS